MAEISREVLALKDELVELRRDFHAHPELGFREVRSAQKIADYLSALGLAVRDGIAETGVTALLEGGKKGRTLLLRADMDALPIEEETGLSFASQNKGVMHACGHDAHMASLLVAAKILCDKKEDLAGSVRFVFQPNEEVAGAARMIEEGALLTTPSVDGAMALHVWSGIPSGKMGLSSGPVMAAMDEFRLVLNGRGGHTGAPHKALDPILGAVNFVGALQMIQTREIDVLSPTSIVVGAIHAGGQASNVIPEMAELTGTVRYLYAGGAHTAEHPLIRFERVLKGTCVAHGLTYALNWIPSNSCLVNDDKMANLLENVGVGILGADGVIPYRCMAGEDFSEFACKVPSVFAFVGTGNVLKGTNYPQHHSKFDIDEDALPLIVELFVRFTRRFLTDLGALSDDRG